MTIQLAYQSARAGVAIQEYGERGFEVHAEADGEDDLVERGGVGSGEGVWVEGEEEEDVGNNEEGEEIRCVDRIRYQSNASESNKEGDGREERRRAPRRVRGRVITRAVGVFQLRGCCLHGTGTFL